MRGCQLTSLREESKLAATMTLICTLITNAGIVQSSDSNLTSASGAAGPGKKVFRLDFGDGALAVAGSYAVGGHSMEAWMPDCITTYSATTAPTVAGFSEYLRTRLSTEMLEHEWKRGCLIHVAGYTAGGGGTHAELWFVRNVERIDEQTGAYVGPSAQFLLSEDFWNRDYLSPTTKAVFQSGGYQRYFNGFPPGRIAFFGLSNMLQSFFNQVWGHPSWKFRPPQSLDELASFVELEIRAIGTMFGSSNYPAPYIGGDVQIEVIAPPPGAVTL